MRRLITPVLVVVLAAGCGTGGAGHDDSAGSARGQHPTTATPAGARPAATPGAPGPEGVVADDRSVLLDAVVTLGPDGPAVAAWWGCVETGCHGRRAIAASDDGFATASYEPWSRRRWQARTGATGTPPAVPALEGLLQQPVTSMSGDQQTRVVAAGGDGATLLPFQEVARSTDRGKAWEVYDVDLGDPLGYQSGAVGLADGRLLVLLDHFSDETRGRPADRWHGLWASDGGDWSSYAPHRASFEPALRPAPGGWSPLVALDARPGVLWVRTWDSRLYTSTDDATTFREVRAL